MRVAGVVLVLLSLPFLLLSSGCAGRADPKYTVSFDVEELPPEPPAPPPTPPSDLLRTLQVSGEGPFDPSSTVGVSVTGRPGLAVQVRTGSDGPSAPLREDSASPGTYRGRLALEGLAPGTYRPVATARGESGAFVLPADGTIRLVASLEEERLRALNSRLAPVYFETSRWDLTPAGIQAIMANASILNDSGGFRAVVEGHGDARGTDTHNKWLGLWRAKVVKEALVAAGVHPNSLFLLTFGRSRPAVQGESDESLARNRRVEIRVSSTR